MGGAFKATADPAQPPKPIINNTAIRTREKLIQPVSSLPSVVTYIQLCWTTLLLFIGQVAIRDQFCSSFLYHT
jgi:hypothetical protein